MASQPIRVAIFPYIPDLAGDKLAGLKKYIEDEFKKSTGEHVEVISTADKFDPYDLDKFKTQYLCDGEGAFDVMEADTILLGELVRTGKLQALEDYFEVTEDAGFTRIAVHSVNYSSHMKDHLYGVPTLHCASFLMELADYKHDPNHPLLKDWSSFEQLKTALDQAEAAESGHRILLAGDFRGSWGLPMFYLEARVDDDGTGKLYEDIDAPVDHTVTERLKEFVDFGKLASGKNPDISGTFHDHHGRLVREVVDSRHILMYAYSENLGEALQRAGEKQKQKRTLAIVSPPLGDSNHLLTYTDAVVVNKSRFADSQRAAVITKFIRFYTSLPFRTAIAFGKDLPPSVMYPRYVLPTRSAFFTDTAAASDKYYKDFHAALEHSTPAPNHDIYQKRLALNKQLEKALGLSPKAQSQLI